MEMTEAERLEEVRNHPGNAPEFAPETLPPDENSPLKGKTMIFLGSSVTEGYASLENSYVEFIGKKDGVTCVKEAVGGTTLVNDSPDSYIPRMKTIDPALHADLFVCQLSTNDCRLEKTPDSVASAIEEIINYVRATWKCPIMFYTNPKYDKAPYAILVERLKEIAREKHIGVIDFWSDDVFNDLTPEQRALYMFDPVHPTMAGYRLWWLPVMEKKIEEYICTYES